MTALGADPDSLDALADACRVAARRLDEVARATGAALRRTAWEGPDAERFERRWRTSHRVALERCATGCRDLGRALDHQAADQRRASAAGSRPTSATGPRLTPLPRSTRVYSGTLLASLGPVTAGLSGTLVIEDLGGGRTGVSSTNGIGAGPGGSAGAAAGVSIGSHRIETGAAVAADGMVEGWTTRHWTVADDEVPGLLVGLAAEGTALGLPFRAVDTVAQGVDDVLAWFGRDADLGGTASYPGVPDPDHVEQLVGLSASAAVALGGPVASAGASAATTDRLLAGTAADGDRSSLVLEEQGRVSAVLGGALRHVLGLVGVEPSSASVQATTRVEVPLSAGHRDDRPLLVTMSTDDGAGRTVVRVAVDRAMAGTAGRHLADALADLARGDGAAARRGLDGLRLPEGSVHVELSTARVERSALALPIQLPGASLAPGGSLTTITPR